MHLILLTLLSLVLTPTGHGFFVKTRLPQSSMGLSHGVPRKIYSTSVLHPDDYLDMKEALSAPLDVILRSKKFAGMRFNIAEMPGRAALLLPKVAALFHPTDCIAFVASLLIYKPLLRLLYRAVTWLAAQAKTTPLANASKGEEGSKSESMPRQPLVCPYELSLFGRLEQPVLFALGLMPFVYLLDIVSIMLHTLGFEFHIKGDVPRLLVTVYQTFVCGCFITRVKDWGLTKHRSKHTKLLAGAGGLVPAERDHMRDTVVDELSSLIVWALLGGLCLEAMSLEMGFALGSIFAVGGIGSASVVLALRDTMENVIGGLMLKFEDKLRVGEVISIPKNNNNKAKNDEEGVVEDISYIATTLRREDNSVVVVPNQVFSKGEIINWSRTPFRQFKTSVLVKIADYGILGQIITLVKAEIGKVEGVEQSERGGSNRLLIRAVNCCC
jgi:small-conductance mechanosensitive channel